MHIPILYYRYGKAIYVDKGIDDDVYGNYDMVVGINDYLANDNSRTY